MEPAINKTVLPNGVRILTKKAPYVRSISMGIWVEIGARDESVAENGISHFIEHMIFKGTRRRSAFQIAKEFDAVGGMNNAFTSMEHTCFHARIIDTHLDTMVDVMSDIFLNSLFENKEIERERPVVFQEIGMVEDTPEELVQQLSDRLIWGNHPLGRSILGTRENLITFDSDAIRRFFRRRYQPDRILIAAAGNINHEQLVDLTAEAFGALPAGNGPPVREQPKIETGISITERDLEQTHIVMGFPGLPVTDRRRYPLSVLNTVLGGNMSSRLFQEIREESGLAYIVYSFVGSFIDAGILGVYTAVDPENTAAAVRKIRRQTARMAEAAIDPETLSGAKEYLKGGILLSAENMDSHMTRLTQNEIHHGRPVPISEVLEKLEAVTAEDLQVLAADLLQPNPMTLTLLGPIVDESEIRRVLDDAP
jgi:predicted Zn-dependent peptidase